MIIIITSNQTEYLVVKPTKHAQDLYAQNNTMLIKEIKDDIIHGDTLPSGAERRITSNTSILPTWPTSLTQFPASHRKLCVCGCGQADAEATPRGWPASASKAAGAHLRPCKPHSTVMETAGYRQRQGHARDRTRKKQTHQAARASLTKLQKPFPGGGQGLQQPDIHRQTSPHRQNSVQMDHRRECMSRKLLEKNTGDKSLQLGARWRVLTYDTESTIQKMRNW